MIFVALTLPQTEKACASSASVVLAEIPPTKIRFGTNVPYFGAIVRLAPEAGLDAGLDPSVPPVEVEL